MDGPSECYNPNPHAAARLAALAHAEANSVNLTVLAELQRLGSQRRETRSKPDIADDYTTLRATDKRASG